ncbi:lasso peptide biosynthesis PqqD family chaperone [Mesobacillus subterraneus]|uniref:lasso peptide biosynthesis PqqD family chaperone n=1 Tax=Mesobacillus subterraneus TaxID=285983 RepID=UPI00203CA086|nr:lasso peptide biosynthesis PqqD family chaperone [Mesobacillus subterraneus]MCM3574678.1 lasso peptide biosynthesis PqqD family chaperone [Mesobacillus subterraneus]
MHSVHNLSVESMINRNLGFFASDMGGEKVLLSIDSGKYYNLGEIGGQIWDLIESKCSVNNLIETLTTEFAIEQDQCEVQVLEFLESLYKEGLIEIHEI